MFGINEFMKNLIDKQPLTQQERFEIINSNKVSLEVIEYLSEKLKNLTIEICGDYEGNIIELMKQKLLEGWCWQTTESAILFLDENAYIQRGNLKFEQDYYYYHSWICFKYKNKEYTFDPSLDLLCEKRLYDKIFEVQIKGAVTHVEVNEFFINYMNKPKKKEEYESEASQFMRRFLETHCKKGLERQKDEIHISGNEDANSPMFRNNTGYKAEIENGKVKKLIAHYYLNG